MLLIISSILLIFAIAALVGLSLLIDARYKQSAEAQRHEVTRDFLDRMAELEGEYKAVIERKQQTIYALLAQQTQRERAHRRLLNAPPPDAQTWLRRVPDADLRNQVDVEIKFIYPLLKLLCYGDDAISLRYDLAPLAADRSDESSISYAESVEEPNVEAVGTPTHIQVCNPVEPPRDEPQSNPLAVDWIIWCDGRATNSRRAWAVVVPQPPHRPLSDAAQAHAHARAAALDAPLYLITNGHELKLFRRARLHGAPSSGTTEHAAEPDDASADECIMDCRVAQLPRAWSTLVNALGKGADDAGSEYPVARRHQKG